MAKAKREIVLETIQAGGATMETLMEAADCKQASVASMMSTLRLMGHYPVKDVPMTVEVDGEETEVMTYRIADKEEWDKLQAEKAERASSNKKPAKTPAERLELAKKRVERCEKTVTNANERANKSNTEIAELRARKAQIEMKIAEHELAEAQMAVDNTSAEDVTTEGNFE